MKKLSTIIFMALIVPSIGMAQQQTRAQKLAAQLAKIPPDSCVGIDKDWNYVAVPCGEVVGVHTQQFDTATEVASGGAPPQPQTKHRGPKLTATAGGILVQWTDASSGTGIGYLIRAGATSGGEATTPITPSMIDVGQVCPTTASYCTYVDATAVAGAQKCYIVAATDGATRTSAYSSPDACFTIPLPALSTPVLGPLVPN
jgi:hypothetical protein